MLWVARGAAQSRLLDSVIVATDDARIAAVAREDGFEVAMTPAELASGSDRVWEAARGTGAEIVVNVQGDEAAVIGAVVDSCVEPLLRGDEADVVTLRTPILDETELKSPNAVKVVSDARGMALYFSRSVIPHAEGVRAGLHHRHVGIYAYRRAALERFCSLPRSPLEEAESLEQLRGLEAGLRYLVLDTEYRSLDVNTPADLERAEKEIEPRWERG